MLALAQATSPPAHWGYYLIRSLEADASRCDDFDHGREEQLDETLNFIRSGDPLDDQTRSRLDRIPWNRAKKYRRLRQRFSEGAAAVRPGDASHVQATTVADAVAAITEVMSPNHKAIEYRLAFGETYSEVASDHGVTSGALKVRVKRWRDVIRAAVKV